MSHKLLFALSGLSVASSLLVAGLLTGSQPEPTGPAAEHVSLVQGVESATLLPASEPAAPVERKQRRRASLSMPYFSFAQSLRPRS